MPMIQMKSTITTSSRATILAGMVRAALCRVIVSAGMMRAARATKPKRSTVHMEATCPHATTTISTTRRASTTRYLIQTQDQMRTSPMHRPQQDLQWDCIYMHNFDGGETNIMHAKRSLLHGDTLQTIGICGYQFRHQPHTKTLNKTSIREHQPPGANSSIAIYRSDPVLTTPGGTAKALSATRCIFDMAKVANDGHG